MPHRDLSPLQGQSVPNPLPATAPRVGLDQLDRLPLNTLPEDVAVAAQPTLIDSVTAITTEGPRGPALRRLLARDAVLARSQLRFLEGVRNLELQRYLKGTVSERRVEVLERLANAQHRRLLATIDAMVRLDGAAATIHVSAHQAAVVVGQTKAT